MPVPSVITDLSQTAASNYPQGTDSPSTLDDVQRAISGFLAGLRDGKGFSGAVSVVSAATTDLGAQNSLSIEVSGTATITSFGTNYNGPRFVRFTGAVVLTHNTTTLNLPGAANITAAAGDTAIVIPNLTLSGWNVQSYQRAGGSAAAGANTDITSLSVLATVNSNTIGYRNVPQNSQSAAYTTVLGDAGFHILHPTADTTARIFTIPANSSVAYPVGTAITFVNQHGAGVITIAITTDAMYLAGQGTTGSRTLAANGIATALKVTSTEWMISGSGLT